MSLGMYLCLVKLNKTEKAIDELNRYASKYKISLYKDTLVELMSDMQKDNATDFKDVVYSLAEKHGIPLIISV